MDSVISLEHVRKVFVGMNQETQALADITLSVGRGEFVGLVGPSGCGKTTVLSLIAGLIKPDGGTVLLDGETVTGPHPKVGYMFQQDYLFEWRSVLSNALLGPEVNHSIGGNRREYEVKARELLKRLGLGDKLKNHPHELSGGQRQRVALARTLMTDPEILLLDEPFSAIDYQTRLSLQDEMYQVLRGAGKSMLLVTHDIPEAVAMCDRVVVLSKGPSHVKKEFVLDPECRSCTPLNARKSAHFGQYFNLIWGELDV